VVTVAAAGLPPGDADGASTVRRLAKEIPLPPGTEVVDFGLAPLTNASLDAMLAMLGLSVFLVLVVMAVQFESLSQPLLVLLAVPMAGAGALPALLLTGNGFDVMSGIGLVILAGISVNNAIVLVTTANQRRDAGEAPDLAISAAAKERLRPILMTTTTTILGLAPLAIGWGEGAELRVPLAIAVMGGLLSSTVLVLIALPSVLRLVSRRATGS
jgi:HAE1 family hydrophobic/amphiphilic exporter-1